MDLVIDAGNTRTKLALFDGDRLLDRRILASTDAAGIIAASETWRPARIAWGSVAKDEPDLLRKLGAIAPVLMISGASPSPLTNAYSTSLTLGADRLANAVAAAAMFPNRAVLAIDMGTCITYDVVDALGTYRGGAITPGARMRSQAMHDYSARLPLVDLEDGGGPFASTTPGSLKAGILHGVIGEARAFIDSHRHQTPDGAVVLTGGDAPRFARALKSGIFAHPFLTLEGYRLILVHQAASGPSGGGASGPGHRTGPTG